TPTNDASSTGSDVVTGDLMTCDPIETATSCPPAPRLAPIELPEDDDVANPEIVVRSGKGDVIVEDLLMREVY
ncbi:hypothetical protein P691DRAFT_805270, partial [Macrolepiota fuliginosa MF-IS2]